MCAAASVFPLDRAGSDCSARALLARRSVCAGCAPDAVRGVQSAARAARPPSFTAPCSPMDSKCSAPPHRPSAIPFGLVSQIGPRSLRSPLHLHRMQRGTRANEASSSCTPENGREAGSQLERKRRSRLAPDDRADNAIEGRNRSSQQGRPDAARNSRGGGRLPRCFAPAATIG